MIKKTAKKAVKRTKKEQIPNIPTPPPVPEKVNVDGFLCPACKFKMRVYMTRPLTGSVYRQRICDRCGTREHTEERAV